MPGAPGTDSRVPGPLRGPRACRGSRPCALRPGLEGFARRSLFSARIGLPASRRVSPWKIGGLAWPKPFPPCFQASSPARGTDCCGPRMPCAVSSARTARCVVASWRAGSRIGQHATNHCPGVRGPEPIRFGILQTCWRDGPWSASRLRDTAYSSRAFGDSTPSRRSHPRSNGSHLRPSVPWVIS